MRKKANICEKSQLYSIFCNFNATKSASSSSELEFEEHLPTKEWRRRPTSSRQATVGTTLHQR